MTSRRQFLKVVPALSISPLLLNRSTAATPIVEEWPPNGWTITNQSFSFKIDGPFTESVTMYNPDSKIWRSFTKTNGQITSVREMRL